MVFLCSKISSIIINLASHVCYLLHQQEFGHKNTSENFKVKICKDLTPVLFVVINALLLGCSEQLA